MKPPFTHNPYTGTPRDPRDIASDPFAVLCVAADEPLRAATQAPSAPVAPIDERSAFQRAMNAARLFPRELDFSMTKSPSGKRDEYVNTHLESCWNGWQARAALSVQGGTRAIVIKGDEYLVTFKPDDEVEVVWKGPYLAAPTPPTTGEE